MSYAWLDYPMPQVDRFVAESRPDDTVWQALSSVFIRAVRQGWDVGHAALYTAWRVENWEVTLRLALTPPPDVIEKWSARGWTVVQLPDDVRAQLMELLPQ